jgi:hypothetical protein
MSNESRQPVSKTLARLTFVDAGLWGEFGVSTGDEVTLYDGHHSDDPQDNDEFADDAFAGLLSLTSKLVNASNWGKGIGTSS